MNLETYLGAMELCVFLYMAVTTLGGAPIWLTIDR